MNLGFLVTIILRLLIDKISVKSDLTCRWTKWLSL